MRFTIAIGAAVALLFSIRPTHARAVGSTIADDLVQRDVVSPPAHYYPVDEDNELEKRSVISPGKPPPTHSYPVDDDETLEKRDEPKPHYYPVDEDDALERKAV